jgi:uncharacterized membrane protein YraQ (UPF0718 family)
MKKKTFILIIIVCLYSAFMIFSFSFDYKSGIQIGNNFIKYSLNLIKMLPFVFILIGLFEAWIKKETVEKHLGKNSNFLGYIWAVLLGGTTLGPMIVSLPIANSLYNKGAKLSIIFTYIGAACVCRIPMTIFEASYLGVKFTIIRYSVSIPLIILSSIILGKFLQRKNFQIKSEN